MPFPHLDKKPVFGKAVFVAPTAVVIGDVTAGDDVGFWFGVSVRGDVNFIRIGEDTNVQDGSILHVTTERHPLVIGRGVTIGHGAIVHGCTVEDGCLIGIGARVLDGAVLEAGCIIGAGAVVTPGTRIPSGQLAIGLPARPARSLKEEEKSLILRTAEHYVKLKDEYLKKKVEETGSRSQEPGGRSSGP